VSPRNFNSAEVLGFRDAALGAGAQFFGQEQREQRLMSSKDTGIAGPAKPTVLIDPINLQNDATRQPPIPFWERVREESGLARA
jgi:hypothetical protein